MSTSLPLEVWDIICDILNEDQSDYDQNQFHQPTWLKRNGASQPARVALKSLRLVNNVTHEASSAVLFRSVSFRSLECDVEEQKRFKGICSLSKPSWVRSTRFVCDNRLADAEDITHVESLESWYSNREDAASLVKELGPYLQRLNALRVLEVSGRPCRRRPKGASWHTMFWLSMLSKHASSIEHLELTTIEPWTVTVGSEESCIPPLRQLDFESLTMYGISDRRLSQEQALSRNTGTIRLLKSLTPNLHLRQLKLFNAPLPPEAAEITGLEELTMYSIPIGGPRYTDSGVIVSAGNLTKLLARNNDTLRKLHIATIDLDGGPWQTVFEALQDAPSLWSLSLNRLMYASDIPLEGKCLSEEEIATLKIAGNQIALYSRRQGDIDALSRLCDKVRQNISNRTKNTGLESAVDVLNDIEAHCRYTSCENGLVEFHKPA